MTSYSNDLNVTESAGDARLLNSIVGPHTGLPVNTRDNNFSNNLRFGSGQAVLRLEDQALLTGAGQYTDDVRLPRQSQRPGAHT